MPVSGCCRVPREAPTPESPSGTWPYSPGCPTRARSQRPCVKACKTACARVCRLELGCPRSGGLPCALSGRGRGGLQWCPPHPLGPSDSTLGHCRCQVSLHRLFSRTDIRTDRQVSKLNTRLCSLKGTTALQLSCPTGLQNNKRLGKEGMACGCPTHRADIRLVLCLSMGRESTSHAPLSVIRVHVASFPAFLHPRPLEDDLRLPITGLIILASPHLHQHFQGRPGLKADSPKKAET